MISRQVVKKKKKITIIESNYGKKKKIRYDSIIYLMAEGSYSRIFFKDGSSSLQSKHLRQFQILLGERFFRCHKSFLINTDYILRVRRDNKIVLAEGIEVKLAIRRRKEVIKILSITPITPN